MDAPQGVPTGAASAALTTPAPRRTGTACTSTCCDWKAPSVDAGGNAVLGACTAKPATAAATCVDAYAEAVYAPANSVGVARATAAAVGATPAFFDARRDQGDIYLVPNFHTSQMSAVPVSAASDQTLTQRAVVSADNGVGDAQKFFVITDADGTVTLDVEKIAVPANTIPWVTFKYQFSAGTAAAAAKFEVVVKNKRKNPEAVVDTKLISSTSGSDSDYCVAQDYTSSYHPKMGLDSPVALPNVAGTPVAGYTGYSLLQCADACDANAACKGFEYGDGADAKKCILTTAATVGVCGGACPAHDFKFYQKVDAGRCNVAAGGATTNFAACGAGATFSAAKQMLAPATCAYVKNANEGMAYTGTEAACLAEEGVCTILGASPAPGLPRGRLPRGRQASSGTRYTRLRDSPQGPPQGLATTAVYTLRGPLCGPLCGPLPPSRSDAAAPRRQGGPRPRHGRHDPVHRHRRLPGRRLARRGRQHGRQHRRRGLRCGRAGAVRGAPLPLWASHRPHRHHRNGFGRAVAPHHRPLPAHQAW